MSKWVARHVVLTAAVVAQGVVAQQAGPPARQVPPEDPYIMFERVVWQSARASKMQLDKSSILFAKRSEVQDGVERTIIPLQFRVPSDVALEFASAVATGIEAGAEPAWRLESFDMDFKPDDAGPQWRGRLHQMVFSQPKPARRPLPTPSPATDSPTPRISGAAALAQFRATLAAVATKLGPTVVRPSSLRIQAGDDHKGLRLDLAFDIVGEHYRSLYATFVSAFDKAAEAKDSAFARVRSDPREQPRADASGASYTMTIELRDPASPQPAGR